MEVVHPAQELNFELRIKQLAPAEHHQQSALKTLTTGQNLPSNILE